MGGSAASEAIFFIGAVVVATGLVAAFADNLGDLTGGVRSRGSALAQSLRTDLIIINDAQNMATSPLVLYVKNTGDEHLIVDDTNVFLDGEASGDLTFDVLASTDDSTWRPGEVLKITVNDLTVTSGDHRVRVVASTGVGAEFEFNKA